MKSAMRRKPAPHVLDLPPQTHASTHSPDGQRQLAVTAWARGGLRVLYRVNQNVNLTFGYNVRATPWAAYTDEFIGFYENSYWDTESAAQNVFYDFNGNDEWENDELVGTYTEILDPVLNEPYITNEFNAKKRIWAWKHRICTSDLDLGKCNS